MHKIRGKGTSSYLGNWASCLEVLFTLWLLLIDFSFAVWLCFNWAVLMWTVAPWAGTGLGSHCRVCVWAWHRHMYSPALGMTIHGTFCNPGATSPHSRLLCLHSAPQTQRRLSKIMTFVEIQTPGFHRDLVLVCFYPVGHFQGYYPGKESNS